MPAISVLVRRIEQILGILNDVEYAGLLAIEVDFLHPGYDSDEEALKLSMQKITGLMRWMPPSPGIV